MLSQEAGFPGLRNSMTTASRNTAAQGLGIPFMKERRFLFSFSCLEATQNSLLVG